VAPMMAAGTVLQTASYVLQEQFHRVRASFARNHTVVVGLGDVGTRLALALTEAGQKVVAVTADGGLGGVASARKHDIAVMVGDPAEGATLRAARVDRASRLVVVSDSDAVNVDTVAVARGLRKPGRPALRCTVQLDDAQLCALLRGGDLDSRDQLRVNFFNLHDSAARTWLAEHPDLGDRPLVLGLGQLGRSLVVAAAQRWAQDSLAAQGPLKLTVIDRSASGRWQALRMQHPAIAEVCEPVLLDLDMDAPTQDRSTGCTICWEPSRRRGPRSPSTRSPWPCRPPCCCTRRCGRARRRLWCAPSRRRGWRRYWAMAPRTRRLRRSRA
jgi:hypothetical protein